MDLVIQSVSEKMDVTHPSISFPIKWFDYIFSVDDRLCMEGQELSTPGLQSCLIHTQQEHLDFRFIDSDVEFKSYLIL